MTRRIDLDAKRRARHNREPVTLVLDGKAFALAPELPLEAAEMAERNDLMGIVRMLVAAEQWEDFLAARPSMNDVVDLLQFYGEELGESVVSIASSPNNGQPSRPTSPATTVLTSPTPAGASTP